MAEAVSPQSVIASPSRSAAGAVVEQGATLVGDRGSLVEHAIRQIVAQQNGTAILDEVRARAEREVDALMGTSAPAPTPAPAVEPDPVPEPSSTDPAAGDD